MHFSQCWRCDALDTNTISMQSRHGNAARPERKRHNGTGRITYYYVRWSTDGLLFSLFWFFFSPPLISFDFAPQSFCFVSSIQFCFYFSIHFLSSQSTLEWYTLSTRYCACMEKEWNAQYTKNRDWNSKNVSEFFISPLQQHKIIVSDYDDDDGEVFLCFQLNVDNHNKLEWKSETEIKINLIKTRVK